MPIRVLVVDDSVFFRRRIKEIITGDARLEVVGEAANGAEAVELAVRLKPNVITMDIEMPVMDGITATRRIMQLAPCPILMLSSLTIEGAQASLDALDAGAVDFLPKRFEDMAKNSAEATRVLCDTLSTLSFGHAFPPGKMGHPDTSRALPPTSSVESRVQGGTVSPVTPASRKREFKLLAIGTSTGGPLALQEVLTKLPASFPLPIVIVLHMPGSYTPAYASRLDQLCSINVKEAADGDILQPGTAYIAPGGMQMVIEENHNDHQFVRILEPEEGQIYKPSVDITFRSLARVFPSQTLAVILTGMGSDGRVGARLLKQCGSQVWSQDEQSSVVYGMPEAVVEEGLSDRVLALSEFGPALAQL